MLKISKAFKNNALKVFFYFSLMSLSFLFSVNTFAATNLEGIQVYQRHSPEHKQKLADDITRYRNADNLWDVLRDEFSLPHYEETPAVQEKIEWFMNNQDYLLRSASRAAPYLYYIFQQVRKRHLPAELVLLPIIESGYDPFSLSNMGAAGIWQLMPDTASGYGVKQNGWYDGRRDVIVSTRAALNYLAYLQSFFDGNWLYAIAAYNTGEGNVLAAIKKNIRDGRDTDFWSLPVAQQTKDYVPSLLALAVIISNPDKYPVYFPTVRNAPYLAQVDISTQMNLKFAANLAGLAYKKLMQLNPGFTRLTTSSGPSKLVLPIENVEQFTENLDNTPLNPRINWIHYKTKMGDTLVAVAKKFNTSVSAIQQLNHLSSKATLKHNMNLLIPNSGAPVDIADIPTERLAENADNESPTAQLFTKNTTTPTHSKLQAGDTIYMVRANDNLDSIAKRFKIDKNAIQVSNNLKTTKVTPGKELLIPTHLLAQVSSSDKTLQPGDTIYMVRQGDTIAKIANKFKIDPAAVRLANLVDDNSLMEGEKLVIPTHMRG